MKTPSRKAPRPLWLLFVSFLLSFLKVGQAGEIETGGFGVASPDLQSHFGDLSRLDGVSLVLVCTGDSKSGDPGFVISVGIGRNVRKGLTEPEVMSSQTRYYVRMHDTKAGLLNTVVERPITEREIESSLAKRLCLCIGRVGLRLKYKWEPSGMASDGGRLGAFAVKMENVGWMIGSYDGAYRKPDPESSGYMVLAKRLFDYVNARDEAELIVLQKRLAKAVNGFEARLSD